MRKTTLKGLKKKAWKVTSAFVRQLGRNEHGENWCVTCGKKLPWRELHCGHFLHGINFWTGMDIRNLNPQCAGCNTYRGGRLIEYSEYLRKKYGPEIIQTLIELKRQPFKPSKEYYEDIIKRYS